MERGDVPAGSSSGVFHGYGKHRRLFGRLVRSERCDLAPAFISIVGEGRSCFGIKIEFQR
jgi:hypothetical protein